MRAESGTTAAGRGRRTARYGTKEVARLRRKNRKVVERPNSKGWKEGKGGSAGSKVKFQALGGGRETKLGPINQCKQKRDRLYG